MIGSAVRVRLLEGFSDPGVDPQRWQALLGRGPTNTVFLTWHYLNAWWECFGRGRLLLLAAERDGSLSAIAPLFCDGGMVFFAGSGGSDYLDFIGDAGDAGTLAALLSAAREAAPDFAGFRFYHVPEASPTGGTLREAADSLGLLLYEEGDMVAPRLVFGSGGTSADVIASKKSLVRHENLFRREGSLEFFHSGAAEETMAWLEDFFEQHAGRWAATPYPSLFLDPVQRRFYRALTEAGSQAGWLRFARLEWDGRPIAFHFGFHYAGEYLWYKPSFDIALARRSPGEVLLRRLLLAAGEEGASVFDFGLGDEPFKRRFASAVPVVRTWGLYPKGI
jgi:CelD/BcsL family acetyltransferase involved in cellulose biosynthesis